MISKRAISILATAWAVSGAAQAGAIGEKAQGQELGCAPETRRIHTMISTPASGPGESSVTRHESLAIADTKILPQPTTGGGAGQPSTETAI